MVNHVPRDTKNMAYHGHWGRGGGQQSMTEHGQPCFLVKKNNEITQSDLNHFHLKWSSIYLDGKQSTGYMYMCKMANPSRKTFLHCQYLGHAVKPFTKMQGGVE